MSHPSSSAPATLTSILIMYDYNVYSQKIPCIFTCRHHSLSPGEETSFTVQNHLSYLLISPHSKHPRLFALPGQKQPTHANTQRRGDSGHGPPGSGIHQASAPGVSPPRTPLFLHPRPKHDRPQIPKHQRPADPDRTRRKSSLKDSQHTILAHRLHNAFPQRISKP